MKRHVRILEIEAFLRFAHAEWPKLRVRVRDQISRRCERCILSERYVRLCDGLCDLCLSAQESSDGSQHNHFRDRESLAEDLRNILHQHEGGGRNWYDALVLFSGGKDSAYLLHRLSTEHQGLRLLALTVDNGFLSPVALTNAHRVLERLQTDHTIFKPKSSVYKRTFRHALTHLDQGGCYTTVDRMDGDLVFDIGRNLAALWEIPLVIAGLSDAQVRRIFGLEAFETLRADERKKRVESAGFLLADVYGPEDLRYWWDGTAWTEKRIPRVLYPFVAWNYDEQFICKEVVRLGLIEPGQDNPLITNNDTIPVMLAVDYARLGYSGFEPEFAALVRDGKAERAVWLNLFGAIEYLAMQGRFLPNCVDDTIGRLSLSRQDVGIPSLKG